MFSSAHTITPDAIDIDLVVDGHPELDRLIRVPSGAPVRWVIEAFLLSIGVPHDGAEPDDWRYDDPVIDWPGGRYRDAWEWSARGDMVRDLPIPGFPHEVQFMFRRAPAPLIGDPQVSVIAEVPRRRQLGPWQTCDAVASQDDVNHELLRRFSVVLPSVGSIAAVSPSRGGVARLPNRGAARRTHPCPPAGAAHTPRRFGTPRGQRA